MIPVTNAVTVEGNIDANSTRADIDAESVNQIIQILTDMYSDPMEACIREYGCNARDSHVEAGQTRPIEVTLPTLEHPFYKTRDYGIGLNVDEAISTYSMYGKSTKRGDNAAIGTFGIGSKSALTYTNAFTVEAIKDGVKTVLSVHKDADGIGVVDVMDTLSTTEGNGVTVIVPVKDRMAFSNAARRFYSFWEPGTVLIDGEEPKPFAGSEISDNLWITDDNESYVIMGNVAYEISSDYTIQGVSYVARVNIGDVAIAPSREALYYNPKTVAVVEGIVQKINKTLLKSVQDSVDACATPVEGYREFTKWERKIPRDILSKVTYRGKQWPYNVKTERHFSYDSRSYRYAVQGENYIHYQGLANGIVITNYPPKSGISATHKAKMKEYAKDVEGFNGKFIVMHGTLNEPWAEGAHTVDWSVVSKIKLDSSSTGGGGHHTKQIKGSFELWDETKWGLSFFTEVSSLDSSKPIVYCSPSDFNTETRKIAGVKDLLPSDVQYVRVTNNRVARFKALFPKAVHLRDWISNQEAKILKAATPDELARRNMENSYSFSNLSRFARYCKKNNAVINDPALAEQMRIALLTDNLSPRLTFMNRIRVALNMARTQADSVVCLLDKYPLVGSLYHDTEYKHAVCYINAAYAEGLVS